MQRVLWFSRLQGDVRAEDYARFVREVDYPATERIPSILHYESIRVHGPAVGKEKLPYHFVDVADITDIAAYRKDLESHPAVQEVHGQFEKYVQSIGNLWGVLVDPGAGEAGLAKTKIVWFSRLQPGIDPEAYEAWVRRVDYPGAQQVPSLTSYRVFRIEGPCVGPLSNLFNYDYFEVAEVSDMKEYLSDLERHPAAQAIIAEIGRYVSSVGSAWGFPVEVQGRK